MTTKPISFRLLEQHRFYLGLSRRDMAAILGVTRQTYHNWAMGGNIKDCHRVSDRARDVVAKATADRWSETGANLPNSTARKQQLLALLNER